MRLIISAFVSLSSIIGVGKPALPELDKRVHDRLVGLETQGLVFEQRIKALATVEDQLTRKVIDLEKANASLEQRTSRFQNEHANGERLSRLGSLLLLIALVIELFGAFLLAGANMAAEQERVPSLLVTHSSNDLAMRDINRERLFAYLNIVGVLLLAFAFNIQLGATLLVLRTPIWEICVALLFGASISCLLVWFFLGQSPMQGRSEKMSILWWNTQRLFVSPILSAVLRLEICDLCLRRLRIKEAIVYWIQQPNSEEHRYLYPPYDICLIHETCRDDQVSYSIRNLFTTEDEAKVGSMIQTSTPQRFIDEHYPHYLKWFAASKKEWSNKSGKKEKETQSESEMRKIRIRLNKSA